MELQSTATQFPGRRFEVAEHILHLVHDPEDRWQAMTGLIAGAKRSIRMFTYMIDVDQCGKYVRDALVRAAKRGVDVQIIVDSFGSGDISDGFFDPLIAAGGTYHSFGSRWGFGYIVRNHQKMLIVDDAHALVGGFNVTDYYFGRKGDNSWEDLGLIISGPEVPHLSEYYTALDRISEDGNVAFLKMRRIIRQWKPGTGTIRWLLGGPTNRISPWALELKRRLEIAKGLDIVSAYFSPSQTILRRIGAVSRRGGQSRLILAGKTDNGATIGAARSLYRFLMRRGTRIFEFDPRPLHMKLLVVDDAVYIGSANLDVRSLFINLEIMLCIEDEGFAAALRGLVDTLEADSIEQTRELLKERDNLWTRFKAGLAYFLVNTVDYSIGRRIKFGLLKNR